MLPLLFAAFVSFAVAGWACLRWGCYCLKAGNWGLLYIGFTYHITFDCSHNLIIKIYDI